MSSISIPDGATVAKIFAGLTGSKLKLAVKSEPQEAEPGDPVAVFRLDDGSLAGACNTTLALAARMGAMLAMIPAAVAEEAEKECVLPENLAENYREVMNVCAQILSEESAPSVRLDAFYTDRSSLPDDIKEMLSAPRERVDFDVSSPDGVSGGIAFLSA